jgi:hypothetical protein
MGPRIPLENIAGVHRLCELNAHHQGGQFLIMVMQSSRGFRFLSAILIEVTFVGPALLALYRLSL